MALCHQQKAKILDLKETQYKCLRCPLNRLELIISWFSWFLAYSSHILSSPLLLSHPPLLLCLHGLVQSIASVSPTASGGSLYKGQGKREILLIACLSFIGQGS